jgi:chorismate synthase
MSANRFGEKFVIQTFGESHGSGLGVVIDGCPSGIEFNKKLLDFEMSRRRPGIQKGVSARNESDQVELLSGVYENKTLGTPICMMVKNQDAKSADYEQIKNQPRTGHADDVWKLKFGHTDPRGGGRSSGRETVSRVMAGSVAKMILEQKYPKIKVRAYLYQIGPHILDENSEAQFLESKKICDDFSFRFPTQNPNLSKQIESELFSLQEKGESWGAQVRMVIEDHPAGLGQPVFHKLKSDFAQALMSIGATSAFEFGAGTAASIALGTDFHAHEGAQYGGIRGGISTGDPMVMSVFFKPTSSILDVAKKGRHDPCIGIRAVPVVEAMGALVLVDHLLWQQLDRV